MEAVILFLISLIVSIIIYLRRSLVTCTSKVCMKGKVVIVTGANRGIGFHTAKNLAKRGARVILACRSEARGIAARDSIVAETGNKEVIFRKLDLASLKSVRQFAENIIETEDQLHVLVNNACIYGFPDFTEDGILEGMQINYFGHFLLTLLLLPLLKKSEPSRIVNLSSILHFLGRFDPETINKKKIRHFQDWRNYNNSKLCMLMFTVELSRRLAGTRVVANAVHPGGVKTDICVNSCVVQRIWFWCCCQLYNRTADQGAQTVEHVAVSEECAEVSGKYFVDCTSRFMSWRASSEYAGRQLWECSEKLVGYKEPCIKSCY